MDRKAWLTRLSASDSRLGTLLRAYFNQDWDVISGSTWQEVVTAFLRDAGPEQGEQAAHELDELLGADASEEDVRWLLRDGIHAAFNAPYHGFPDYTAWLVSLREELRGQARIPKGDERA